MYFIGEREFELPESKLLVDVVQSSKFITHKKSEELIKKIEKLTSVHEAKDLHRQVIVSDRVKTMNESIYYNVDAISTAGLSGPFFRQPSTRCIAFKVMMIVQENDDLPSHRDSDNFL